MSTDRTKLALRRQSIRTLTADELSVAHGGKNAAAPEPTTNVPIPTTIVLGTVTAHAR
jgi:hypothetical protein